MDMTQKLEYYLRANYYCLAITTFEEARSIEAVTAVAGTMEKTVYVFSLAEGIKQGTETITAEDDEWNKHLLAMKSLPDNSIILMLDPPIKDEQSHRERRHFRDLIYAAPKKGSVVILIAPFFKPWSEIEKFVTIIEFSLPNKKDLEDVVQKSFESLKEGADKKRIDKVKKSITPELIKALSGLSTAEAENALFLAWAETEIFDPQIIYREKIAAVKRTDLLEIVEPEPLGLDAIGGLGNLKNWIKKRRTAYSAEAEKYKLPTPKGILITGVPGTGKSLSAKAIGTALGVPTLHLDVGKLFGGIVGETEQKTRDTLTLAEAISPCVLWIDEVEKALETSSGGGDSGVSRRLFGKLLQWMQDKKAPVFLVMTANEVWNLPAPFLRKGRFDELFAVDLPTKSERLEILSIVITERGRDPKHFDLEKLAVATEGFVGSELKSVMADALYDVFDPETLVEPTTEDLLKAAKATIPISKTAEADVKKIRDWAKGRAKSASFSEAVVESTGRKITRKE